MTRMPGKVALQLGMLALVAACQPGPAPVAGTARQLVSQPAAFWNSATIYFLLTDRFANGDSSNDTALGRGEASTLRRFEGGDLKGVLEKLEEGYFDSLGVDAIWMTPFVEQIHGSVDEGTGKTYGFHGYWTRDWTRVDPALGTDEDLKALVDAAHRHGIRMIMDAVINHPGPVTPVDPAWPDSWVRSSPQCRYTDYASTVTCTLVRTLPDVRTESDAPVELPPALVAKWQQEGRLEQERKELDAFFHRTGYPRAPRYYITKWLTDWVREIGFDGYRLDTAKHVEETVAAELKKEAEQALRDWKTAHPEKVLDSLPFYMVGEVYGYGVGGDRAYDYGDRKVDFYEFGFDALINFGFKAQARGSLSALYAKYAAALHGGALNGVAILNYVSSHDDGGPYDVDRQDPLGAGTRLLLAPGGAQIYYGDELARPLRIQGAEGDANLRSFMNWDDLALGGATRATLEHWRKLGRFRQAHPAVGAGEHRELSTQPYVFSRIFEGDTVVVGLELRSGAKSVPVQGIFGDGTELVDAYSGQSARVSGGSVTISSAFDVVLLARK